MAVDRPTSLLPEITTFLCYNSSGGVKKQWEGTCGGGGWGAGGLEPACRASSGGRHSVHLNLGKHCGLESCTSRGRLVTVVCAGGLPFVLLP